MALVTGSTDNGKTPGEWFTTIVINGVGQLDTVQGNNTAEAALDLLNGKTFSVTKAEAHNYDETDFNTNHILGTNDSAYTDYIEFDDFPGHKLRADIALDVNITVNTTTGASANVAADLSQFQLPDSSWRIMLQPDGATALDNLTGSINTVTFTSVSATKNGLYYVDRDIRSSIVCFARGTQIETPTGRVPVERLNPGDMILTRDEGPQPIRWIRSRQIDAVDLQLHPNWRPVRICTGALGPDYPDSDLIVSPQHRILLSSRIINRISGANEMLVPAKKLLDLDGVEIMHEVENVEYWHFLFDRHQIVISNGLPTESLYTGPEALKAISREAVAELRALIPEAFAANGVPSEPVLARGVLASKQLRKLLHRHKKNNKPLIRDFDNRAPIARSHSPTVEYT